MPDLLLELFSGKSAHAGEAAEDLRKMVTDKLSPRASFMKAQSVRHAASSLTVQGIPARAPDLREEKPARTN